MALPTNCRPYLVQKDEDRTAVAKSLFYLRQIILLRELWSWTFMQLEEDLLDWDARSLERTAKAESENRFGMNWTSLALEISWWLGEHVPCCLNGTFHRISEPRLGRIHLRVFKLFFNGSLIVLWYIWGFQTLEISLVVWHDFSTPTILYYIRFARQRDAKVWIHVCAFPPIRLYNCPWAWTCHRSCQFWFSQQPLWTTTSILWGVRVLIQTSMQLSSRRFIHK